MGRDLPYIIQIDNSWYFHKYTNYDSEEYLGESIGDEPIIKLMKKLHPGLRFEVLTMYRYRIIEPDPDAVPEIFPPIPNKKIYMYPGWEYGGGLFWDRDIYGQILGGCKYLGISEANYRTSLDLSNVDGLKEWFEDWDFENFMVYRNWTDEQWKDWWAKGLELAKYIKTKLPDNVDLYYFSLKDPIWEVRPEDATYGGIFNKGTPIKIE